MALFCAGMSAQLVCNELGLVILQQGLSMKNQLAFGWFVFYELVLQNNNNNIKLCHVA